MSAAVLSFPQPPTKRELFVEMMGGDEERWGGFWDDHPAIRSHHTVEGMRARIENNRQRACDEARATLAKWGKQYPP